MKITYYKTDDDALKHIEFSEEANWVDGFAPKEGVSEIIYQRSSDTKEVTIPFHRFISATPDDIERASKAATAPMWFAYRAVFSVTAEVTLPNIFAQPGQSGPHIKEDVGTIAQNSLQPFFPSPNLLENTAKIIQNGLNSSNNPVHQTVTFSHFDYIYPAKPLGGGMFEPLEADATAYCFTQYKPLKTIPTKL